MEEETGNFEWYQVVEDDSIEQGDFIDNFPILIPVKDENTLNTDISGSVHLHDVIVMTQSCDFQKMTDDSFVILCARYSFKTLGWNKDKWSNLIKGRLIGVHLINKGDFDENSFDYQVVDLSKVFSVPLYIVKSVIEQQEMRIRLQPPYREHLSQAFARMFMRVGLPSDLPRDYPY